MRRITKAEADYLGHSAWYVTVNGQDVYETNLPRDVGREALIAQGHSWNGHAWTR